jgi:hypothetical protein
LALVWVDVEARRAVRKRIPAVFVKPVLAHAGFKNSARSDNKSPIQHTLVELRVQMHPHTSRPLRRLSRGDRSSNCDGSIDDKSHTSPLAGFGLLHYLAIAAGHACLAFTHPLGITSAAWHLGVRREFNGVTSQSIAVQIVFTIRIGLALLTNGEALASVTTISTNAGCAGCV